MATFRADIEAANDNRNKRKLKWVMTIFAVLLVVGTIGYFETRRYFLNGLPDLPNKEAMWQLNAQTSVTLLDKDGVEIGHRGVYFGKAHSINELPSYLPDAFLAIEDRRFFEHDGVDNKAIIRAFFANFRAQDRVQGGSTLTQQLVKNMVLSPEKSYRRKVQEAILSRDLERVLTKTEILELYLNRIYFGNAAYGIEAASQRFFGKSATEVNLAEAAMLAGLPKAPSRFNPYTNLDAVRARTSLVLRAMVDAGMITVEDMAEAEANPAEIITPEYDHIPEEILGYVFDQAMERAQKVTGGRAKDIVIYTTLDRDLMLAGHKSLTDTIGKYEKSRKVSEGALVSLDTETGAIRVLIGGRNYTETKFNRASQAKRQPGSSFKTFVYAAALENGYTPGTVRLDQPVNINGWRPENYTESYRGPLTMREALKLSINTIAAQVGAEIGPSRVVELAGRFGINSNLGAHYSIALGSSEVDLVELTGAFTVFANSGLRNDPYLVSKITDSSGTVIYERKDPDGYRVYPAPYARQMTSMLKDTIDSGTGYGAKLRGIEAAGKTGTSQDYRDAWFIGYTSRFTTGVWMGNDDNSSMVKVTGGLLPVDAWKSYMVAAHKGAKTPPLSITDPEITDPKKRRAMTFYAGLSEALISERDLANGVPVVGEAP